MIMSEQEKIKEELKQLRDEQAAISLKYRKLQSKLDILQENDNKQYLNKYYINFLTFMHPIRIDGHSIYGTIVRYVYNQIDTRDYVLIYATNLKQAREVSHEEWMHEVGKMIGRHPDYTDAFAQESR